MPALTPEQQSRVARMQGDLRWLVTEGYVTEFLDGRLFAPPAMVDARKKEIESSEHDPENFPEVPAVESAPAAAPAVVTESASAVASEPVAGAADSVAEAPASAPEGTSGATPSSAS